MAGEGVAYLKSVGGIARLLSMVINRLYAFIATMVDGNEQCVVCILCRCFPDLTLVLVMILGELCNFAGTWYFYWQAYLFLCPVLQHTHSWKLSSSYVMILHVTMSRLIATPDATRGPIRRHLCHSVILLPQRKAYVLRVVRVYPMYSTFCIRALLFSLN